MQLNNVDLDANTAAAIAAGMRKVAKADGDELHPNELSLIESFEEGLPTGPTGSPAFLDSQLRDVYLKSLVMVALADGRISQVEREVIEDLAKGVGADTDDIARAMRSVKDEFLSVFSGVTHFKDQVEKVADELESEISS